MTLEEVTTLKEAIKRLKEVIKEVRSTIQPFLYDNEAKDYILKALEQPKWIPVSERLPENFQRVLVTVVNYDGYKVVRVAEYYGKQRIFQIKENREQWKVGEKGLLAWMPLPEPYKAESEDNK